MTLRCSPAVTGSYISSTVAHFAFKHKYICRTTSIDLRLHLHKKSYTACCHCGFLKFLDGNIWTYIKYIC